MLSLYLHIPFCHTKCKYCSFFVTPEELVEDKKMQIMKEEYTQVLLRQIAWWKAVFPDEQIRTLYIWGGTPFQLGKENLTMVVETIFQTRDCSLLEELSIELNPDPIEETLLFVEEVSQRRKDLFRLRFSFGIQSFDDTILQESKRAYTFAQLPDFLRKLQKIKGANVCYNLDFIAFGNRTGVKRAEDDVYTPRWAEQQTFFQKLVSSQMIDGFSIYTLELFPWSDRYNQFHQQPTTQTDETIYDEFDRLATVVETNGYRRYELSNFALAGKQSIHNMVYRTMWSYLGLGINASSMLVAADAIRVPPLAESHDLEHTAGVRFKVTDQRKTLATGALIDPASVQVLSEQDWLIDELMLKLRTDQRIRDREKYLPILEANRQDQVAERIEQGFMTYDESFGWQMSTYGLDLYNTLITDLVKFGKKG